MLFWSSLRIWQLIKQLEPRLSKVYILSTSDLVCSSTSNFSGEAADSHSFWCYLCCPEILGFSNHYTAVFYKKINKSINHIDVLPSISESRTLPRLGLAFHGLLDVQHTWACDKPVSHIYLDTWGNIVSLTFGNRLDPIILFCHAKPSNGEQLPSQVTCILFCFSVLNLVMETSCLQKYRWRMMLSDTEMSCVMLVHSATLVFCCTFRFRWWWRFQLNEMPGIILVLSATLEYMHVATEISHSVLFTRLVRKKFGVSQPNFEKFAEPQFFMLPSLVSNFGDFQF